MPVRPDPLLVHPEHWATCSCLCILNGMNVELPTVIDPLGEALHFLRMSGIFYSRSEFTAP
jgi:hypothetical protein